MAKAYTTRVGAGPLPHRAVCEIWAIVLRATGAEFGTTTGRPRRCGWLDVVILRYAARVNGLDEIALTKLDVLSGIEQLKVAVAYERTGERIEYFPAEFGVGALEGWTPVYEELTGWREDISGARTRAELPVAARIYRPAGGVGGGAGDIRRRRA